MDAITRQELERIAPAAKPAYLDALVNGWDEIRRTGIDTPLKFCEFFAQIAHETGGFTILTENLNYTATRMCEVWPTRFRSKLDPKAIMCAGQPEKLAEAVYGGRLGNTDKGDGYAYRGRGFLQDTGRDCYREYGQFIGVDLEGNPELLETPTISLRVALARWKKMDLNRFAERHYSRAIGNAINRGSPYSEHNPIGYKSRQSWFQRAWVMFGDDGEVKVLPGLALGAYGARVETLQARLKELGYPIGTMDKVFGPNTARAVAAFKLDHRRVTGADLEPDEVVGPLTEAALETGKPIELSDARKAADEKTLAKAGSTEVAAGQAQKAAGNAVAVGAGLKGAQESGMLESAQAQLAWLPTLHKFMGPVLDAINWGVKHAFWVIALVLGVWVWTKGRAGIMARLEAHRKGLNLGR